MDYEDDFKERKRYAARYGHCDVCGREMLKVEAVCPQCGRRCCGSSCYSNYVDKEKRLDVFLCNFCYFTVTGQVKEEEERKESEEREDRIRWWLTALAAVLLIYSILKVMKWL
jgi:hypothetical protein